MNNIQMDFIVQNRETDTRGNPMFSGIPSTYTMAVERPLTSKDVQDLIWEAIETEGVPEGAFFAVDVDVEHDDGSTDHDEGFGVVKKLVVTGTPSRFFRWNNTHLATIFTVNRETSQLEFV